MTSNSNKSQTEWFYDEYWTPPVEAYFLEEMNSELCQRDGGKHSCFTPELRLGFLHRITPKMNFCFRLTFNEDYYIDRLSFLEQRFITFDWLIKSSGVEWVESSGTVHASSAAWEFVTAVKPLSGAYKDAGEPHFKLLRNLFEVDKSRPSSWDFAEFELPTIPSPTYSDEYPDTD